MGYNKRKRAARKRSTSEDSDRSQGSNSSSGPSGGEGVVTTPSTRKTTKRGSVWSWREKNEVLSFLKDYRHGCEKVYYGETPVEKEPKRIGVTTFPALTRPVFLQPFLNLPSTLTSKHRRIIHECCMEVGLYHMSTGSNRHERTIAVSAYADGLQADLDQSGVSYPMPIYKYRPWYCRKERAKDKTERLQRQEIDHLIDQPGECLRESLDQMDFAKWDTADLSSYKMPPQLEQDDTWMLVDTPEKMQQCINELTTKHPTELAFDLESYNRSKFSQLTCLLQISTDAGRDYVIDTLAPGVWDCVHGLAPFFADPSIVKVGHAIGGLDVRSLHRDFGIFVVNVFDTYEAARVMGMGQQGLAAVCSHYNMPDSDVYTALKKNYQNCDWRQRPLTPPMMQYGRYDVHYLLRLRWLMIRDLTRRELWDQTTAEQRAEDQRVGTAVSSTLARYAQLEDDDEYWESGGNLSSSFEVVAGSDAGEVASTGFADDHDDDSEDERNPIASVQVLRLQPDLMRVISHSQQRCRDLWSDKKEVFVNHPLRIHFAQQARRKRLDWTLNNEALLEKLVEWRNQAARQLECLPGFVAPLDILLPVALQRPTTKEALRRISLHLPEVLENEPGHLQALLDVVRDSIKAQGGDPSGELILRHIDIGNPRKRKRFPWTMAVLAVGAAGVAVAVMAARHRRRRF